MVVGGFVNTVGSVRELGDTDWLYEAGKSLMDTCDRRKAIHLAAKALLTGSNKLATEQALVIGFTDVTRLRLEMYAKPVRGPCGT